MLTKKIRMERANEKKSKYKNNKWFNGNVYVYLWIYN